MLDWVVYVVIAACAVLAAGAAYGLIREIRNPTPPVVGIPMNRKPL